jgi:MFS family permease
MSHNGTTSRRVDSGTTFSRVGWVREVTRYQWMVFLVAWLGWALDNTDFNLFALVLHPALTELLGGNPSVATIGRVGGILSMVGLLGWALGGFCFGILADYIGRIRTLALSVVMVAIFTALQGFSQGPIMFGACRFFAGIGTGAEFVVGIPLVAEAFAEAPRARVLGFMMTGAASGSIFGGQLFALLGSHGWRYPLFAGVMPALVLLLLRRGMEEPEPFQEVHARRRALKSSARQMSEADRAFRRFAPKQLFSRENRYSTMVGVLLCLGALLGLWASQIWLPTIQGQMLARDGIAGRAAAPLIGHGMMLWGLGGILGQAAFGFVADAIGRRLAIALYSSGTIAAALYLYVGLHDYGLYPIVLPIFGCFVYGVFSGLAVYLPELFPTHVRATAVSFCSGSARVITSFGPLVAGLLVVPFGGNFAKATAVITCFAALSILAVALGRETKNDILPR